MTDVRGAILLLSGLAMLAGFWLVVAPPLLGYGGGDPYWSVGVVGLGIATLGALELVAIHQRT